MTSSRQSLCWKLELISVFAISSVITSGNCAKAQIVPDSTLGAERSVVQPNATNQMIDVISGGARRGANLFHSFEQFSILTGHTAFFNNGVNIQNIITRVTGNQASNIDGILQANSTTNLFLVNPNGIIFGPNASLNIGGSFLASTASSLKFADGTQFSATAPQNTPLLTVSVPIGLQFGGSAAGISVNGSGLATTQGQTLALVGGDITIYGGNFPGPDGTNLEAREGRIELGSVAENSLVNLTAIDQGWSLGYTGVQNFKNINLFQGAFVNAPSFNTSGGNIQVQGRQVLLQDGAAIAVPTRGSKSGGTLVVKASNFVELSGVTPFGPGGLFAQADPNGEGATGNAGSVSITTRQLVIQDGAAADTSTFGTGQAGNLTVKASDSIQLSGRTPDNQFPSGLFSQVAKNGTGTGSAGDITIETGQLSVLGGAQISTAGRAGGKGGTLTINAADSVQLSGTAPNASVIQISGASPTATEIQGASGVFVSAQPGTGATSSAGELTINTGQLTVENGAEISADSFGLAQGGNANLNVGQLIIRNGGRVGAGAFGEGLGGSLTVKATDSVEVSGTTTVGSQTLKSILFTGAEASGNAGDLNIMTGSLNVRDGGAVTVSSAGSGKAGNLQLTAGSIGLDNGSLTSTTFSGDGGNIILQGQNLLLLRNGGQISTTAGTAKVGGNGGKISITAPFVIAVPQENSSISANAFKGNGGSVTINASGIFGFQQPALNQSQIAASNQSQITATSTGGGLNGVVTLNTPEIDPSRGLVALPIIFADVSRQIAQGCGNGNRTTGQFIVTGRGGLPPNPSDTLSNDAILDDTRLPTATVRKKQSATVASTPPSAPDTVPIVPATGAVFNGNDEVTLIAAAAPTATIQIPWLSPTACRAYAS